MRISGRIVCCVLSVSVSMSLSVSVSARTSARGGIVGMWIAQVRSNHLAYALVWGEDTTGQLGMRGLQAARSPTIMRDMAVVSPPPSSPHHLSRIISPQ